VSPKPGGCGCSGGSGMEPFAFMLGAVAYLRRRRRAGGK
jgi:uncharacterized protein (TIGR03382 family)